MLVDCINFSSENGTILEIYAQCDDIYRDEDIKVFSTLKLKRPLYPHIRKYRHIACKSLKLFRFHDFY